MFFSPQWIPQLHGFSAFFFFFPGDAMYLFFLHSCPNPFQDSCHGERRWWSPAGTVGFADHWTIQCYFPGLTWCRCPCGLARVHCICAWNFQSVHRCLEWRLSSSRLKISRDHCWNINVMNVYKCVSIFSISQHWASLANGWCQEAGLPLWLKATKASTSELEHRILRIAHRRDIKEDFWKVKTVYVIQPYDGLMNHIIPL